MTSLKLNIGQKMLRFWKETSENLKTGKLTLAPSSFQKLFIMKFDSKSRRFEAKSLFLNKFIAKKREWGKNVK